MRTSLFAGASLLAACVARAPALGVGTHRPPLAPLVVSGDFDAWHVLGDVPGHALRLGAGTPSLVGVGLTVENDWIGGFTEVSPDDCLLVYARGGPSVTDVDVAIYSDDGAVLAADEGRDVHPTVVLCAPHPARLYVAGHVAEGEGLVAVAAQLVPRERAGIVARALGALGTLDQGSLPPDVGPGLDDAVRRHYLELGSAWQEVRRLPLTVDSRVTAYFAVPIEASHCVDVFVAPAEDIGPLEVELLDSDGRTLARSRDGSGPRSLTVCAATASTGTLAIRPHVGHGLAAIVVAHAGAEVYRDISARPDVAWVIPRQSLQVAKRALESALETDGYPAPLATSSGVLTLGARVQIPVDLRAPDGACLRLDVTGGEPLGLIDARLWSDGGLLLASDEAASSTVLFGCARGIARLELEAREHGGPFWMTVRPERWRDAAFERLPLAASRMLARSGLGQQKVFQGQERSVRTIPLDAASVVAWSETLPAGRCARLAAGIQGEGAGLEIRAFDETDEELDRAEASGAATVRACAPPGLGRAVRFEIRASAGNVKAIVGERLE